MPDLTELFRGWNVSLSGVLTALATLAVCLVVSRLVRRALGRLLERSRLDVRMQRYLLSAVRGALYLVTAIIVVGSLGVDMTSLVALLSVVSLGVTLAAEDILANVAGGLVLLSSHPFAIGDYIEVSGTSGTVEEIRLNHTKLVTPDGLVVLLPNKTLADSQVTNYTTLGRRRVSQVIGASYDDPTDRVKAACLEAMARTEGILPDPAPAVYVTGYGESAVEYTLYCWTSADNYLPVKYALAEHLRSAFDERGVTIPYNYLNVRVVPPPCGAGPDAGSREDPGAEI